LQGAYFAEAAYASERALSWMLTVVGDPLYRPFRVPLVSAVDDASTPRSAHDDWLLLQQVRRDLITGKLASTTDALKSVLDFPGAGPVAEEGLGDLLEKLNDPVHPSEIEAAYQKALAGEAAPIDRIRVGLKLAQYYDNHGQDALAQAEIDALREFCPDDATRFGVPPLLVPTSVTPEPVPTSRLSLVPVPAPSSNGHPTLPQLPSLPKPTPDH